MKKRLALAAVLALAAIPVSANAQLWLSDRRLKEGPGIRVGDLELHPALGGEVGYDSNYSLRAPSEDPDPKYRLKITPAFSVSSLGRQRRLVEIDKPPMVMFDATAYATYHAVFAAGADNSREDSKTQQHVDGGASLLVRLGYRRPLGGDLGIDYQHFSERSNLPGESNAFDRGSVRVTPGITWMPGGGLFEWRVGYEFMYSYFVAAQFARLEHVDHALVTRGRWRFLPRTALLYDASYRYIGYTHESGPANGDVVRARVGLNGLVLPRLALLAMGGWTSSFYDEKADSARRNADNFLVHVEAKYFVLAPPSLDAAAGETPSATTGLSTVALGYTRELTNSYLNSYAQVDRGYLRALYFLGGAFAASVTGGFSHVRYPASPLYGAFSQNRVDARLFAEYRFSDSFGLNATALFDKNMSEPLRPPTEDLDYTRWQVYLGARWFM